MSMPIFCSNSFWPLPEKETYMIALLSGGIDPVLGLIDHWLIFKPTSSFAPLPPFFAYFFTSFASFLPAFLGSPATGAEMLFAASNFACLSF